MVLEKECCNCKQVKAAIEFGKDKRTTSKLKSRCRDCQKKYNQAYIQKNKDKLYAKNKVYRDKNTDRLRAVARVYYWENREECLSRNREYRKRDYVKVRHSERMRKSREENPEHHKQVAKRSYLKNRQSRLESLRERYKNNSEDYKESVKQYRKENLQKILYWNRQRKIRKTEISGDHTFEQWLELCSFFDDVCPCCKGKGKKLTVDHIKPLSWENTSNWITNIQPLCISCNSSKSNSHATDYRPEYVKQWALEQMNENRLLYILSPR